MWPCRNEGEDARLYAAVEAMSDFAIDLGVNIPTGKDSLSMTQKYKGGDVVISPGTVIVTAGAEVTDIRKVVSPVLQEQLTSTLIYIDFSKSEFNLGGSSFGQIINRIGDETPSCEFPSYFRNAFTVLQHLINEGAVLAGHDISAGGLITTLLEMTFSSNTIGLNLDLSSIEEADIIRLLFSEKPSVVIQVNDLDYVTVLLHENGIRYHVIGAPEFGRTIRIAHHDEVYSFDIDALRDDWFRSSYLLDRCQSGEKKALERFENYKTTELPELRPPSFVRRVQMVTAKWHMPFILQGLM
jgi:phosphoribosylformylglycinamidine synthase